MLHTSKWAKYAFPNAGFVVALPAKPTHTVVEDSAPFAAETLYHEIATKRRGALFVVSVWLYRSRLDEMLAYDVDYEDVKRQFAEDLDILAFESIDMDRYEAREMTYLHEGRTHRARCCWIPESPFSGGARRVVLEAGADAEDATHFFESFQVTPSTWLRAHLERMMDQASGASDHEGPVREWAMGRTLPESVQDAPRDVLLRWYTIRLGLRTIWSDAYGRYALTRRNEVVFLSDPLFTAYAQAPPRPRPVSRHDRRLTYILAANMDPTLAHLMPEREAADVTCPHCGGSGTMSEPDEELQRRGAPCWCAGAGWLPDGAGPFEFR